MAIDVTLTSTPEPSATRADAASSTQWPAVITARVAMIVPEQSTVAPEGVTRCRRTMGEFVAEHVDPFAIAVDLLTVEPIAAHGPVAIGTAVGVVEGDELPQPASAQTSPAADIALATRRAPAVTPG